MASTVLPCGIRVYHFGPAHAPLTIIFFNGFIGRVTWSAGLTLGSEHLRPDSMFGRLLARGDVRIVLFEHPSRLIDPDTDFPQLLRYVGNRNVISGLSRGAQLASDFYRWVVTHERVALQNMGLFMISAPGSVSDLASANLARRVQWVHTPYALGGPLMHLLGERRFLNPDAIAALESSGRAADISGMLQSIRTSGWVVATTRQLATFNGFGLPMLTGRRVVAVNIEHDMDIHVESSLAAIHATYPDCIDWTLMDTTGHGMPDVDARQYQDLWSVLYTHFVREFNLAA